MKICSMKNNSQPKLSMHLCPAKQCTVQSWPNNITIETVGPPPTQKSSTQIRPENVQTSRSFRQFENDLKFSTDVNPGTGCKKSPQIAKRRNRNFLPRIHRAMKQLNQRHEISCHAIPVDVTVFAFFFEYFMQRKYGKEDKTERKSEIEEI